MTLNLDGKNIDSSDQIETKDIQSPQNVTITAITDVTTNAKSNNAKNSDKINIDSFSLLESIETRIKNLELQTDRYEYLHFVLFSHNTSIHKTTNLTPNFKVPYKIKKKEREKILLKYTEQTSKNSSRYAKKKGYQHY